MYNLSTREIEQQIANYALQFDTLKDDEIEWRYQPPPFVATFVAFIEEHRRVPTQVEFVEHYVAQNRTALNAEFLRKWTRAEHAQKKRALLARVAHAYPSFVRDLYFCALLREQGLHVEYDPTQDVEEGVDLVVTHAGRRVQLHLFLASTRARQGRAKKNRRHHFAGEHLDIVLQPDECKSVGAFWLPTLTHVQMVKLFLGDG
ncbi:MAG: hypothetical protein N2559_07450 [Anaerolineae bacterium]|nr:hypothetical protein [Anaerolineae bacterium]